MSFVKGLFGGDSGANWQAQQAGIINPGIEAGQAEADRASALAGIQKQQDFLNAVQGQNGLGNQAQVYNQLQGIANGTGPNPAQAMLNQATGQNVANQAALMASQRGVNANPGLIARQAAQQGANIQQQAVGQGATLQANQALNAIGAAGQLANTQAGQQANALNAYNNLVQGEQGQTLQNVANYNNALTQNASQANASQSKIAQGNQGFQAGVTQGITGAIGKGLGGMFAEGGNVSAAPGAVPDAASGAKSRLGQAIESGFQPQQSSDSNYNAGATSGSDLAGGVMDLGKKLLSSGAGSAGGAGAGGAGAGGASSLMSSIGPALQMMAAKGGKVPALVSPGERYLPPKEVEKVAKGQKSPIKAGEKIPGKPKVGGAKDSYANDTVHKTLEAGGIVLPRHVTQAKDPAEAAKKFVAAVLAKSGKSLSKR